MLLICVVIYLMNIALFRNRTKQKNATIGKTWKKMSEIKTPLIELEEGQIYKAKKNDFVITDDHTFSDIIRFLISQGCDKEEAMMLYEYE